MQILPRQTQPPTTPIRRRHHPKENGGKGNYRKFRACLRWEFGFTCPFCLVHEADLARVFSEGTAQTAIEHIVPQSADEGLRNTYTNCVYICRFCNTARSNLPVIGQQATLLNPTSTAWGTNFELDNEQLKPLNEDAAYTEQSYDINDPRKKLLKRERMRVYDDHFPLIDKADDILELIDLARQQTDIEAKKLLLDAAESQRLATLHAIADLKTYSIKPCDAPTKCSCDKVELELPEDIASQALSL
ncbi:MAG: HNH endonuclease [Planctomycetales bacterium]|nr:HNH endonuclease [Planctomycetales bacterium]